MTDSMPEMAMGAALTWDDDVYEDLPQSPVRHDGRVNLRNAASWAGSRPSSSASVKAATGAGRLLDIRLSCTEFIQQRVQPGRGPGRGRVVAQGVDARAIELAVENARIASPE